MSPKGKLCLGWRLLAGSAIAGLALLPQVALAQGGPAPDQQRTAQEPQEGGIQDIVVTARYVAENIQDTPIAITAKTNDQLVAANVTGTATLGAVVPNLFTSPADSQSASAPTISLRGVSQGAGAVQSIAIPPAVAIYTDDVYHSTVAGSDLDFTDVVRVEVNRGPQSTLSGNASLGGSIKLFTQDPKGDGSGFASLGYGSFDHVDAAAAIDVGLTSTLAVRGLAHFERQTGFVNRLDFPCMMAKLGTPQLAGTLPSYQPDLAKQGCVIGHLGGGDKMYGQVKIQWKPTDNVKLLITASRRNDNLEETPEVALTYNSSCIGKAPGLPNGYGPQPCTGSALAQFYNLSVYNRYGIIIDNRFRPPLRNGGVYDTYATNCRPDIDLSAALPSVVPGAPPTTFPSNFSEGFCFPQGKKAKHTLVSGKLEWGITDKINMTLIGAYTKYSNEYTQEGDQTPLAGAISHFINLDEMGSGELRFDGKLFDDKLQWVLGGFTVRTIGYQNNLVSYLNIQQLSSVRGLNKSSSAFAHLDYDITDRWRVSGGGRYSHTDIAITIDNPNAGVQLVDPRHGVQNRWDWLISTDFKISDRVMVYANAASGSRPPGLTTIVANARQVAPTSDEALVSYELGLKADMFDRRLRANLTAFYLDYQKLSTGATGSQCLNEPGTGQATFFNVLYTDPAAVEACKIYPGNPVPTRYGYNVGIPAKIKGVEWEITARPIPPLNIDFSGGYNHFKSSAAPGQPGYLYPGNLRQPEWNMHADISYDIDPGVGTFTPRLDWTWQSRQTYDQASSTRAPLPNVVINPYSIWNAQIVYKTPTKDWSATLAVTNLANKFYHYQVLSGSFDDQTRVAEPREWMLTVRKEF
ncbi:TonB-dependent receptor [Sphingobium nicotianae]|uniref:TonB-dependent receptor n=1 Tax=Sphingobium nicotianae TaxID=2782607 RepID=A0A9X1DBF6_9SPHN|nr:TonB-dependent receptor [Sphingobium nicotianae]MBT2186849.1 TonB-dependent receptor [Sphingobium nicotianae]